MRRAKIQDVARLADVSLSTVSAVINDKDIVSEKTKRKVLDAIARLDYQPSLYASNLARHRTRVLGLIVSNLVNPFFAEITQIFEKEAHKHGYQVSLTDTNFSPLQLRMCVRQMLSMRVAGVAVLTSEFDDDAFSLLKSSNIPSVFLDVGTPGPHTGNIRVDTKGGMFLAVHHLVELGHRDILFVRNSRKAEKEPSLLSHRYRSQGLMEAVRKSGADKVKVQVVDISGPGAHAGLRAIRSVIKDRSFTAVVAITDTVAFGVYRGLDEANLRVPQDVSVIGFDNTYLSEFMNPPLSTINIPKEDLGKSAVEMLLQDGESEKHGREVKLRTELIIRKSTAPPAFAR